MLGSHTQRGAQVLTVEFLVPGSQRLGQERAAALHQALEGGFRVPDESLLCLTGTAGVLLGTDPEVLACTAETAGTVGGDRSRCLPSPALFSLLSVSSPSPHNHKSSPINQGCLTAAPGATDVIKCP